MSSKIRSVQWSRTCLTATGTTSYMSRRHIMDGPRTRCGVEIPDDAKRLHDEPNCDSCARAFGPPVRITKHATGQIHERDDGSFVIYSKKHAPLMLSADELESLANMALAAIRNGGGE